MGQVPRLMIEYAFARGCRLCIERDDPLLVVVGDRTKGLVVRLCCIDLGKCGEALQVDKAIVALCHKVDGSVAEDACIDSVSCTTQNKVDLVFESYLGIGCIVRIE